MASVSVVESTCDRCHSSEEHPLSSGIKNGKYVLPNGWLNVHGISNDHTVFDIDLCTECKGTVMDAAGQGRRLKPIRNSA